MTRRKSDDTIRVVLIEDQKITRKCLTSLIDGSTGMTVVGEFGTSREAIAQVEARNPDVILTDLGVPGISGPQLVKALHSLLPSVPIIVLTIHDDEESVFGALCNGAMGYLLKDVEPAELIAGIRDLYGGGSPMSSGIARRAVLRLQERGSVTAPDPMSNRERQVLQMLADGHTYRSCAARLGVSVDTVRFHVRNIYRHLQAHSKGEAVGKAMRQGWIF